MEVHETLIFLQPMSTSYLENEQGGLISPFTIYTVNGLSNFLPYPPLRAIVTKTF